MKLDPRTTAVLTLDLQNAIVANLPNSDSILPAAAKAVDCARAGGFHLMHVGLGFSEGHPEIPDGHPRFGRAKQGNMFVKGSPSAEFHDTVFKPGDLVVYKQRIGAFSENHLELTLRSLGVRHYVLFGIVSSGIVLSTLRRAFDLDFTCTVVKDACFDMDPEVHRVLTEKVFPAQARVVTVDEFVAEQSA